MSNRKKVEEKDEHLEPIMGITPKMFACLAALTLYWGWHFGSYFSNTLIVPLGSIVYSAPYLYVVCLFGASLFHGLLAFLPAAFVKRQLTLLPATVCFASICLVGILAILDCENITIPAWAALTIWFVYGVVLGAMLFFSHTLLANVRSEEICFAIAIAIVLSSLIFLAILNMNRLASIVATIIIALTLIVTLMRLKPAIHEKEAGRNQFPLADIAHASREFRRFLLELFSCSFVFGIAFILIRILQSDGQHQIYIMAALALPGVFLLVYSLVLNRYLDIRAILWMLFGTIAIGLLPLASVAGISIDIGCAFLVFGFTCYDMLTFYRLLNLLRTEQLPYFRFFALARFTNAIAVSLGGVLVFVFQQLGLLNTAAFTFFAFALIVVLFCLTFFLGFPVQQLNHAFDTMGSWQHACQSICNRCGLTPREAEVFGLLAKGRDTEFISEKLFISVHTVKAHRYHIYEKLGIHSQQTLLDMVERQITEERKASNPSRTISKTGK